MQRTFDRVPFFDQRSRAYGIRTRMDVASPRSVVWPCETWLDQGTEGSCVGFALATELATEPVVSNIDARFARERIYYEAQRIDEFRGGEYPGAWPRMEGTSIIAGLKVLKRLKACDSYQWAFGMEDLIVGLQGGPSVLGVTWREGMMEPGSDGLVSVSGRFTGGHAILCRGVDIERKLFILRNSWGNSWGAHGDCYVTYSDMQVLLHEAGEAAFLCDRHVIDIRNLPATHRPWWARFWASITGGH